MARYIRYLNYAEELRTMAQGECDQAISREALLRAASDYDALAKSALHALQSRELLRR